jgi:hypothetical protein
MHYYDDRVPPDRLSTTSHLCKRKRARSPAREIELEPDVDPDMVRAPKRLRRLAVRNASFPTAAVAVRSRRAERLARRKSERRVLHKTKGGGGMEVNH